MFVNTKLRSTPHIFESEHGDVTVLLPQEMGGSAPPMLRLTGDASGNYVLNNAWRKQLLRFKDTDAESERQLQQRGEAPRFNLLIPYTTFEEAQAAQCEDPRLRAQRNSGGSGPRIHYL